MLIGLDHLETADGTGLGETGGWVVGDHLGHRLRVALVLAPVEGRLVGRGAAVGLVLAGMVVLGEVHRLPRLQAVHEGAAELLVTGHDGLVDVQMV